MQIKIGTEIELGKTVSPFDSIRASFPSTGQLQTI